MYALNFCPVFVGVLVWCVIDVEAQILGFFFAFMGSLAFFVPELMVFEYALRLSLVSALTARV
jgi:hypothetical protein